MGEYSRSCQERYRQQKRWCVVFSPTNTWFYMNVTLDHRHVEIVYCDGEKLIRVGKAPNDASFWRMVDTHFEHVYLDVWRPYTRPEELF